MNKELIFTSTKDWDKDKWLRFRKDGIGASEVGTVLGLNPYKSACELWHEKLDPEPVYSVESISQFMGHYDEEKVADLWQYWDGSPESVIANYRAGKIVRKCQRVNGYIQNPKYPWLFVSLDRKINKINGKEGALEIKTINGYEADKWEAGIPMSHVVQLADQMLVCEFEFGELAVLKDGRDFQVYPFEVREAIETVIIERTKHFWDTVKEGRMIATQKFEAARNFNMRYANELQAKLDMLEPEPDGSEAYERFMRDKFKKSMAEVGVIPGTNDALLLARDYKAQQEEMKVLEEKMRRNSNELKRILANNSKMDFGKDGYVSWAGDPRRFSVRLKG
jgi:putative phage-type endonuclease